MHSKRYSLTEGSIWKAMLMFAMPVFLGNVFQQLYNAFDAWCVGNYIGDDALASYRSTYYKYNTATNFDAILKSETEMTAIQKLIDQYMKNKSFRNYP